MGKQPKKKSVMDNIGDAVKTVVRKADSVLSASKPIGASGKYGTVTPLKKATIKKKPKY